MMAILRKMFHRPPVEIPVQTDWKAAERAVKDQQIRQGLEENRVIRKETTRKAMRYVTTMNEAMDIIGGGR